LRKKKKSSRNVLPAALKEGLALMVQPWGDHIGRATMTQRQCALVNKSMGRCRRLQKIPSAVALVWTMPGNCFFRLCAGLA
jgi:hypothetical protein